MRDDLRYHGIGVCEIKTTLGGSPFVETQFADDKPEIGRDGKWQYDAYPPDLTRIELMEPAPTKDPYCSPYSAPHPKL